eukprot:PhF_6_TR11023/c0_g1_i1/m.17853
MRRLCRDSVFRSNFVFHHTIKLCSSTQGTDDDEYVRCFTHHILRNVEDMEEKPPQSGKYSCLLHTLCTLPPESVELFKARGMITCAAHGQLRPKSTCWETTIDVGPGSGGKVRWVCLPDQPCGTPRLCHKHNRLRNHHKVVEVDVGVFECTRQSECRSENAKLPCSIHGRMRNHRDLIDCGNAQWICNPLKPCGLRK